jgi:hypothetical protein
VAKDYCNACEHRDPDATHKYCVECGVELVDQNAICGHDYRNDWKFCPFCVTAMVKA